MSDLIDRKAVLKIINDELEYSDNVYATSKCITIRRAVNDLPSAEPERKKGKWDFMGWQMFQCSECKHTFTQDFLEGWREYTYESHFPPFCPNCGSYNGGEQDEKD